MANILVLIAGVPGSGKTYIGKKLAKRRGIFIDKDTITELFTEKILIELGSNKDQRESNVYWSVIQEIEYKTLIQHALENLNLKNNAFCCAPFIEQFYDREWMSTIESRVKLEKAILLKIWVQTNEKTARERMIARREHRDIGKLSHWKDYARNIDHNPPEHIKDLIIIDNGYSPTIKLTEQLKSVIDTIEKINLSTPITQTKNQ